MRTSNQEILSAYLDGELTTEESAALEAQLETDQVLRADLRELEATVHLVRAHGPTRAPEDFLQEVLERVEQEPVLREAVPHSSRRKCSSGLIAITASSSNEVLRAAETLRRPRRFRARGG